MHLHKQISVFEINNLKDNQTCLKQYGKAKFMDHIVKYLTLVEPEKVDGKYIPESIFLALKEEKFIKSDMGDIPSEWIKSLFKLLFEVPRSKFGPTASTSNKASLYSSAVPYAMYAFKSQHGIKYSEWNLDGPYYGSTEYNGGSIILGQGLKDYIKYKKLYDSLLEKHIDEEGNKLSVDWSTIRQKYLTHGKTFELLDETSWSNGTYTCDDLLTNLSSPIFRKMVTQTWVFSPRLRNEHMVMSFDNIDEMPSALVAASIHTVSGGDMPF